MKRLRDGMDESLGNISGITKQGDKQEGFSSGEESIGGGDDGESKKPRLDGGLDSDQESSTEGSNWDTENESFGEEGTQLVSGSEPVKAPVFFFQVIQRNFVLPT